MKTKRPKLPKPAAPVRARVCCFKREGPLDAVRDEMYLSYAKVWEKRRRYENPDYHSRAIGLYDPRTHRAVPRKKAKKGGG